MKVFYIFRIYLLQYSVRQSLKWKRTQDPFDRVPFPRRSDVSGSGQVHPTTNEVQTSYVLKCHILINSIAHRAILLDLQTILAHRLNRH